MADVGDFLKDLFQDVVGDKEVKTQAVILGVKALTGSNPIVDRTNPNVNVIKFTKTQRLKLEDYMTKKLTTKTGKPSNLKIEHESLWMPFAIKKAMPYAIGLGAIAFMIGRMSK